MVRTVELSGGDAEEVLALYEDHEGWADRSLPDVRRALEHTDLAVGLRDCDRLVAAVRVNTDFVYYAKAYDVVVAGDRRGEGLGRRLLDAVASHEALADMAHRHLELVCREGLVPFYEACGFERFDATVEVEGRTESYLQMNYEWPSDDER